MSNKIFVGGLNWGTTDAGLQEAFSAFGEVVEARVIKDRETGRSRGFGFVTFAETESVAQAIEAMNGTELDGRSIRVNEAQERRERGPRGGGGYRGGRPRRNDGGGYGNDSGW